MSSSTNSDTNYNVEGLKKRRVNCDSGQSDVEDKNDCSLSEIAERYALGSSNTGLTLKEELLLVAMNPNGNNFFMNDKLSLALRGCILIELWILGKIELEPSKRKPLCKRNVVVKDDSFLDDGLLNEVLKLIKAAPPLPVYHWIVYLSGDSWNPMNLKYHIKHLRERLFKSLVERGILTTVTSVHWFVSIINHPVVDENARKLIQNDIKNVLLQKFNSDIHRIGVRGLTLALLMEVSGGTDGCFYECSSDDRDLAFRRLQTLLYTDFNLVSSKGNATDVHWAVYAAFTEKLSNSSFA